jgi:hypothetical protein
MAWFTFVLKVVGWFLKPEDVALLRFFGPLISQVREIALKVGKDNLAIGLDILQDAAIQAVLEAKSAGEGANKVVIAEKTFIEIVKNRGLDAVGNAAAGMIKAAVAILQTTKTS